MFVKKYRTIVSLIIVQVLIAHFTGNTQTIQSLAKDLPPYFSVLTTWGLRPEWDETGKNIYFLDKMIGNVFKINVESHEIMAITNNFYHGGIYRVLCLSNGDLLLAMAPPVFDSRKPEQNRHTGLEFHIRW